ETEQPAAASEERGAGELLAPFAPFERPPHDDALLGGLGHRLDVRVQAPEDADAALEARVDGERALAVERRPHELAAARLLDRRDPRRGDAAAPDPRRPQAQRVAHLASRTADEAARERTRRI